MHKSLSRLALLSVVALFSAVTVAATVHWTYTGKLGPEHWGELSPAFALCASGRNQSPIDLSNFIDAELPPITFDYKGSVKEVVNNGHTVQVNDESGSAIVIDDQRFTLKQFHFHWPSENLVEGRSFPMEAHFVHADDNGNLAVVALMFKEGPANLVLAELWKTLPRAAGTRQPLPSTLRADLLFPANRDYFRYNGSLTTPPCTEGVRWLVLKQPVTVSSTQLKLLAQAIPHANNRPVQPVNARPVLR